MLRIIACLVIVAGVIHTSVLVADTFKILYGAASIGSHMSLDELVEECGYETMEFRKIGEPSSICIDQIHESIQSAHTRGMLATMASGNRNMQLCLKELVELSDDELVQLIGGLGPFASGNSLCVGFGFIS